MNTKRTFDTRREKMSKEKNRGGDARSGVGLRWIWESTGKRLEAARAESGSMRKGSFSRLGRGTSASRRSAQETGKIYNPCSRHVRGWFSTRQSTPFPHSVWKGGRIISSSFSLFPRIGRVLKCPYSRWNTLILLRFFPSLQIAAKSVRWPCPWRSPG